MTIFTFEFFDKETEFLEFEKKLNLEEDKVIQTLDLDEKFKENLYIHGFDITDELKQYVLTLYPDLAENFDNYWVQFTGVQS